MVPIMVDKSPSDSNKKKSSRSLVGRLCSSRTVGKEVIQTTMAKIWKISMPTIFKEIRQNLLTIMFATEADKLKVVEGRPWLFDNLLIALKPLGSTLTPKKMVIDKEAFWVQLHDLSVMCMNRFFGNLIGSSIGQVLDADVELDDTGWGKCQD